MARGDTDLSRRRKLVQALAEGCTNTEAAKRSGYRRQYVQHLKRTKPEIWEEAEALRQAAIAEQVSASPQPVNDFGRQLQQSTRLALLTLARVMEDESAPHRDRVKAASEVLRAGMAAAVAKVSAEAKVHAAEIRAEAPPKKQMTPEEVRELLSL